MKSKTLAASLAFLLLLAVALVAGLMAFHMIRTDPKKARRAHEPLPVTLARARISPIQAVIGAPGETETSEKVVLTARISQPVVSVKVHVGDRVTRGQELIELESRVLQASFSEAEERHAKAASDLEQAERNYARLSRLYEQKLIARVEWEDAAQRVRNAQWELKSAVGQLEKARQELQYTKITSPVTGVVLERSVNVGEIPKVDAPILTLGVIDTVFFKARVPEKEITQVRLGQPATVLLDSFPDKSFSGEIAKIDPTSDVNTRTFSVYVRLPNEGLKLTPGLTGLCRIENSKTALAVPSVCIVQSTGDLSTVFALGADSVVRIRSIKTGISGGGLTEVLEGLQEGDPVVAAGIAFLKDGDTVRVMEEEQ
jgi:RND family efflux transporter MFP subunit